MAKCVHCGKDENLHHGLALVCPGGSLEGKTTSFQEAPEAKSDAAVALLEREDGRILCVWNERYEGWTLPGGKVEPEDGPPGSDYARGRACLRELREETGLSLTNASLIYSGEASKVIEGRGRTVYVFRAKATGTVREEKDGRPVTWLTKETFLKLSPFRDFYVKMFESEKARHAAEAEASVSLEMKRFCDPFGQKGKATLTMPEGPSGPVWLEIFCSCGAGEVKKGALFDGKFVPEVPPELLQGDLALIAIRAWNTQRGAPDVEGRERPVFFDAPCGADGLLDPIVRDQHGNAVGDVRLEGGKLIIRTVGSGGGQSAYVSGGVGSAGCAKAPVCPRCQTLHEDPNAHAAVCSGAPHIEHAVALLRGLERAIGHDEDVLAGYYRKAIEILRAKSSKGATALAGAAVAARIADRSCRGRRPIVTGSESDPLDRNGRKVAVGDELFTGSKWALIGTLTRGLGGLWLATVPGPYVVSSYETRAAPAQKVVSEPLDKNGRKVEPGDEICILHGWYKIARIVGNGLAYIESQDAEGLWQLATRETRPAGRAVEEQGSSIPNDVIDRCWAEGEKEALERELEATRLALANAYDTCAKECDAQVAACRGNRLATESLRGMAERFREKSFQEGALKRWQEIRRAAEERGFRWAVKEMREIITQQNPKTLDIDEACKFLDALHKAKPPA